MYNQLSMQEILEQAVEIMRAAAHDEHERWESGYHWIRHGGREALVVDNYYSANPSDLPSGASIDGVKFGAIGHDVGKTICVSNPGIWHVIAWKITKDEWKEIASHVAMTTRLFDEYEKTYGVVIPTEAYEFATYHHEKLDGSGYFGVQAGGLRHTARLAAVIDQIVSRCENREYRYGRPPLSFLDAFMEVNADRGKLYDAEILDKIWQLYKDNPFIREQGYRWIFQNGHLGR